MSLLDNIRKSVADLSVDTTSPMIDGHSIDPGAEQRLDVARERDRRKFVDLAIAERLRVLGKQTRATLWGIWIIVGFAGCEYIGILGSSKPPVWARAVFDGLAWVLKQI